MPTHLSPDDRGAAHYTAFCQDALGNGTIWIETIGPFRFDDSLDMVAQVAREHCAEDWGQYDEDGTPDIDNIHCLGLARGEIEIAMWEDLNDD